MGEKSYKIVKLPCNHEFRMYKLETGIMSVIIKFESLKGGGLMFKNDRIPNRLAEQKSPYLLQHAYNPVDWYPWGEEAFDKAKTEDKPVFLSIGYS